MAFEINYYNMLILNKRPCDKTSKIEKKNNLFKYNLNKGLVPLLLIIVVHILSENVALFVRLRTSLYSKMTNLVYSIDLMQCSS